MIALLDGLKIVLFGLVDARLVFEPVDFGARVRVHNAVEYDALALLLKHFAIQKLDLRRV